jgi:hypothetical protein
VFWTVEIKFVTLTKGKPGKVQHEIMIHDIPESIKLEKLLSIDFLKNHKDAAQ